MSWGFLCSLDVLRYARLVREFYNTLEKVENGFKYIVEADISILQKMYWLEYSKPLFKDTLKLTSLMKEKY